MIMPGIFQKLNLKNCKEILVLNSPQSFEAELVALEGVTIHCSLAEVEEAGFILAFVIRKVDLDDLAGKVAARAPGDAVVWFAYPKGTSRKYHCDFNRDTGWDALSAAGFRPVRQVAIDEDWSALRFRRTEYVKS